MPSISGRSERVPARKPRLSAENLALVERAFEAIRQARKHLLEAKAALKVTSAIRAGGITHQHNRRVLKVTSGLKAGGIFVNRNPIALAVKAVVKMYASKIRRGLGK